MQSFPPTIILRHRKENLKKCSLTGLESRDDFLFFPYPKPELPDLSRYHLLVLDPEALPLAKEDADCGLFILDATWRYAEKMHQSIKHLRLSLRTIPPKFQTAYPRQQTDCPDPMRGLASIEAIYVAYQILGRDVSGILDNYYWKELFLKRNSLI
jgi:pre-rRNA-processing protein TSR3